MKNLQKERPLDCKEDSTATCFKLEFPKNMTSVHFIKLLLKQGDKTISENFYWRGNVDGNVRLVVVGKVGEKPVVEISGYNLSEK